MPTKLKSRGNCWLARVVIDGQQVDSKVFPPGRSKGPEWMAAKTWEVERKKEFLELRERQRKTLTGFGLLLAWGEAYLDHVGRTMSRITLTEKQTVMQALFGYCREAGLTGVEDLTRSTWTLFLTKVASERGPRRANVYRKNLLAAWNWAVDSGFPGFPQAHCPLERIRPFPVEAGVRYVPPEEDVIKVLQQAHGQDLVMLLTYYYTGARRGEVFRLLWSDVNFDSGSIRLVDHKGRDGSPRSRWVPMHPELAKALRWWQAVRPCVVDNVFMQEHCDGMLGEPFQQRSKLMPRLCRKAGVKPFGFHALRHKAAAITFTAGGLAVAQTLMGHSRATTTDIYVRSAGLSGDRSVMMDALGESSIGIAAEQLLEMEMPRRPEPREAFCKHGSVNNRLQ